MEKSLESLKAKMNFLCESLSLETGIYSLETDFFKPINFMVDGVVETSKCLCTWPFDYMDLYRVFWILVLLFLLVDGSVKTETIS